jgi:class 3 adenylate cyclase
MINLKDEENQNNINLENENMNDYNDYDNEGEIEIGGDNNIQINNSKNENNGSLNSPSKTSGDKFRRSNSLSSTVIINNQTVYVPPWKKKLRNLLDSPPVQITMTIFTVYILFADDIKVICTTKKADPPFSIVVIILMGIFFIELVISAIVVEDYFLGFYFWLDFVSLISMVLDIHWFYDWMINSISGGGSGVKKAKTIGAIAKAGKSAKIAARAIRILRVLRIIRLVRVSKLYKAREKIIKLDMKKKELEKRKENQEKERQKKLEMEKKKEEEMKKLKEDNANAGVEDKKVNDKDENKGEIMTLNKQNNNDGYAKLNIDDEKAKKEEEEKKLEDDDDDDKGNMSETSNSMSKNNDENDSGEVPEESKVGKLLADRTTKKVIILILSMMIGIILFNTSFYLEKKTGMEMGLKIFSNFESMNDPDLNLTFSIYVSENLGTSSPLVYAKVGYLQYQNKSDADHLREQERNAYSEDCSQLLITDGGNSICEATFDVTAANRLSAILNIIKTCFICVVLTVSSYCFSKDTSEMVLDPIETMISKVKEITKNPIEALQKNEKEEITKALLQEEEEKNALCTCDKNQKNKNSYNRKKKQAPLETEVLENTITKIGALLALSFGDAGSEIIAKNMQKNSSGEVNPMIPGKKVCAIYGFCDIRNFTDTTEILQEKVMVFVNEIAEVVHELTSEYGGSANKNIGDAFLLVWKFQERFCFTSKKTNELMVYNCDQVNQLCDMALISIILVLAKIYKSKTFDKYRTNEKLIKKFNGYSVKLGFGLHLGWSIEGAIGSAFKIDASYLSPNANMANTCEEKTKDYGALMIMTDKFVENLSLDAQKRCRIVDIINGDEPVGFYTMDLDLSALTIDEEESDSQNFFNIDEVTRKMTKYQKRMKRKKNLDDAMAIPQKKKFWLDFEESSEDFATMRNIYTDEFYNYYNEGFDEFNFGNWNKAKRLFEEVLKIKPDDKPTIRMMEKMKSFNFKKPQGWIGNTE